MKVSSLIMFGAVLSLTGCFFAKDKEGNKNDQNDSKLILGKVIMKHIQGISVKGDVNVSDITAGFMKKSAVSKGVVKHIGEAFLTVEPKANREEPCKFDKVPKGSAAAASYVSVGKFGFAPEGSQDLVLVPPGKNNVYYGALQSGTFPGGIYQLAAEGSSEAVGFSAKMAMPEELNDVSINNQALANGPTTIKVSDGVNAQWASSKKHLEEYDQVVLSLYADSSSETYILNCQVAEKDLTGQSGYTKWNIPAKYIEKFSASLSDAEIYLFRADPVGAKSASVGEVGFTGIRAWVMKTTFVN